MPCKGNPLSRSEIGKPLPMSEIAEQFNLSRREQEAVEFLLRLIPSEFSCLILISRIFKGPDYLLR
jgi:hypothetical protein